MTATTTTEKGSETPEGVRVSEPATPVVEEDTPGAEAAGEDVDAPGVSPDEYDSLIGMALHVEDISRPRAVQAAEGIFGASDAGQCERRAVWTIQQRPASDVPKLGNAQSGTYLHQGILGAVGALFPERIIEAELSCTLPSGARIMLHPDEIDPSEPSVTDLKTSAQWAAFAKLGPSAQNLMQVNLQYLAAMQAGIITVDTGIVRLLYVNPADLDERHVWQGQFDMEHVHAADDWFQRVIYAVQNGEDGEQQWPENKCRQWCQFYKACRPPLFELNQPITNPDLAELVLLGHQARTERKAWQQVEEHVVAEIKGVSGRVGDVQVVTTTVNGAQRSYQKVEFREVGPS